MGGRISLEFVNLVVLAHVFFLKRQHPSGSIVCLDFQTVTAVTEATASFRHFKLAFLRTSSDRILSESLDFVIVRAVAFMALLISSKTPLHVLSSLDIWTGIVAGQEDRIFPMRIAFANVASK